MKQRVSAMFKLDVYKDMTTASLSHGLKFFELI